jgi:hypothetical protein
VLAVLIDSINNHNKANAAAAAAAATAAALSRRCDSAAPPNELGALLLVLRTSRLHRLATPKLQPVQQLQQLMPI